MTGFFERLAGRPAPMSLRTAFVLGRASNLPTVWTNALAAGALAGAAFGPLETLSVLLILSLYYLGGMWLNDAVDAEIDAAERAERPIPQGLARRADVSAGAAAMLALALALTLTFGPETALAGLALGAAVVAYDLLHKKTRLSPVLMGFCRVAAYAVAAYALGPEGATAAVWLGAAGLFAHIVGLTYTARAEASNRIGALWPLASLAIPILAGLLIAWGSAFALLLWLGFTIWTLKCVALLRWRGPGDVPRAVVSLIAAIALYDAVLIAGMGAPGYAVLGVAAFAATLYLQRAAPGT